MERFPLSLGTAKDETGGGTAQPEKKPVMGWAAVAFGFLGIFGSFVFVPVGLICSVLALFMGQAVWGFLGLLLTAVGILTSPIILGIIGLSAFAFVFDWQSLIQPLLDMFQSDGGPGNGSGGTIKT